jgi:hypothetical protein
MQHDTSPHDAHIGGAVRRVQTASLVACYSRSLFFQFYPRFTRFDCKVFLTDGVQYFGGACGDCMIDNTHVVVLRGTGKAMVPVPEMEAFARRLGFRFIAHEKGDANRSARVERPFHFIENNFLAGRTFTDFADLNRQARAWCDNANAKVRRALHASSVELFAAERPALRPLPAWIPEVYALHQRIVDLEGYIHVDGHIYSVPYQLVGKAVEVRETKQHEADRAGLELIGELAADPHEISFAKNAVALFRMSRSIFASRSSLRSCAISARSSLVSPDLPPSRSARARTTHVRSTDAVSPRSRATRAMVFPSSRTRRTAPALNSSVN